MRKITLASIVLGTITGLFLSAAQAQSITTWVSGTGSDANDCLSPATPCRSFGLAGGALSKTSPGGTINVLPGDYGGVLIDKSIKIIADGGQASIVGGVTSGGIFAGIIVNAGPADVVHIRGMSVNQSDVTRDGIGFVAGKALHLENCTLTGSASGFFGIQFVPNTAATGGVPTELTVRNSTIGSNAGGNVLIRPTNAVAVAALFDGVSINGGGTFGIKADGSGQATGQIDVHVVNSTAEGHVNNGYIAVASVGQAAIHYKITRSIAYNNGASGAVASGAQAFMIVDGSSLTENGTGLAQLDSATVASYGNNAINFNTSNTSGTISTIALK
jgi:hypothetical protein